jgi:membrane fusion protein (multidrug efflux system)
MALMLAAVVVVLAVIGFLKYRQVQTAIAAGASFAPPPTAVSTYVVAEQTWQPVLRAVGSAKAVNGVMVATDLPGIVREIAFESGRPVKKGQVLVRLDTTQEKAQWNAANARLDLAKADLDRKGELLKKRVASQSDYDASMAEYKQAQAALTEVEALVNRKTIRAPFDGILGIREVDLGEYMRSGDTVVPLQSLDPIYADFTLPQQDLGSLKEGRTVEITADGLAGRKFTGTISAIDPNVDASTRNVRARATLANPGGELRSGMFVNVEVLLPTRGKILAIPASAVNYAPYGDTVYVIDSVKNAKGETVKGVRQQAVKLGVSRGDLIEVVKGLQPGDEIVSGGTFKLKNQDPVVINNEIQPDANPSPTPAES